MYENIDVTKSKIQMEEALNKLHWNKMYEEKLVNNTELYDVNTKSVDVNNLRVTS